MEIALLFPPPSLPLIVSAVVLGLGKAVGSGAIFLVGLRVEDNIRHYAARYRIAGQIVGYIVRFVRVTRWIGLFILLSIPFFPDTVPVYLYAFFNKQGQLIHFSAFIGVNFLAGIARGYVFLLIAPLLGF